MIERDIVSAPPDRLQRPSTGWWARLQPFLLWALLGMIFVGGHHGFYFQEAHYEGGDFAANALQIRHAKGLQELYGNYSRFGFHHPGPAFFYAYAAGERILFDLLKVVPAPFNAHSIVGVLLQAGFFTWAIWIVAKRVQRPLLIPLILLFAAIHFGSVNLFLNNTAFQSIWPPHVLLMPFLCFLIAAASVAAGGTQELIPLALSGSFLVHGHVAQPLFVVPLSILAYGAWWLHRRRCGAVLDRKVVATHGWAAGIIAIFLIPLGIDALKGEQSNLLRILHHFSENSADHKTVAQSALYFVTFICHVEPQEFCDRLTVASLGFLHEKWYLLANWVVIGAATGILLLWERRRQRLEDAPFVFWLAAVFIASTFLTLIWGVLQNGPMAGFNSYFNFAILFLPLMLSAISLSSLPAPRLPAVATGGLFVFSLLMLLFASHNFSLGVDFPREPRWTAERQKQIEAAAAADRQTSRTKLLLFGPEDWGEAVRVALALERSHYRYRVQEGWELIFGRGRGVDLARALTNPNIAAWRVKASGPPETWLVTDLPEVDPLSQDILFSTPAVNAQRFVTVGWDISDGHYSWSVGKWAALRFAPRPAKDTVHVICDVTPSTPYQIMIITFNDGPSEAFEITRPTLAVLEIPAEVWNEHPDAILKLDFPNAVSPLAAGVSADARELGCAFTRISFREMP